MVASRVDVAHPVDAPRRRARALAIDAARAPSPSRRASASTPARRSSCTSRTTRASTRKAWRVKDIIRKYSDFVHFPIYVNDERRQPLAGALDAAASRRSPRSSTPSSSATSPAASRRRSRCSPSTGRSTRRCSSTPCSTCPRRRRSISSTGAQGPAPLRQARPHRGGLRQAHARRTSASSAASSTRRTSRSTCRARCSRRTRRSPRSSSRSSSRSLKALKELADERRRRSTSPSGASSAACSRRASPSTGRTWTRSPSSAASSR